MELWQLDVVGGFHLADGTELKRCPGLMTAPGSRCRPNWCGGRPPARCVRRCWRRCAGTEFPDQILTDNGKVFTGRFGPAGSSAEVVFDRICAENGIRHLLTAPRSPTTTGRWSAGIRQYGPSSSPSMITSTPRSRSCSRLWMPG
jgi:hypothetical protein